MGSQGMRLDGGLGVGWYSTGQDPAGEIEDFKLTEALFPDAIPLDEFRTRLVTDPEEMIEEFRSLVREASKISAQLEPIVALVQRESAGDEIGHEHLRAACELLQGWLREYYAEKGYELPMYLEVDVGAALIWWVRHLHNGVGLEPLREIVAEGFEFIPGEPVRIEVVPERDA